MAEVDVVVAGAGPAGSVTALLFARQGFRVTLLDRAHFPRHKACAEFMSPGVVETLERLGIDAPVRAQGPNRVPGMDIISPGGQEFSVTYRENGKQCTAWTLPREILDATLVEQARAEGVDVREGFVAKTVIRGSGGVGGISGTWQNQSSSVPARLTVIADGCRSVLARDLGVARSARWPVRMGLVAHYRGQVQLSNGRGQMHVDSGGYCGVAPLSNGCFNVAVVVKRDAVRRSGMSATTFFERWIAGHDRLLQLLGRCERVTPVRGVGPIGSRSSRAWFPGGLVVGDAASFFDPFTGEGMYRALRGAELAAQVGTVALRVGQIDAVGLAPYDTLRRDAFRNKSAVTALVQLFVQFPRLMEYALPRLANRPGPADDLNMVLGDLRDPRAFLNPGTLLSALRP
jgi:geranylgeranyl reductase family protein